MSDDIVDDVIKVSMGARIEYRTCSLCGGDADGEDICEHLHVPADVADVPIHTVEIQRFLAQLDTQPTKKLGTLAAEAAAGFIATWRQPSIARQVLPVRELTPEEIVAHNEALAKEAEAQHEDV